MLTSAQRHLPGMQVWPLGGSARCDRLDTHVMHCKPPHLTLAPLQQPSMSQLAAKQDSRQTSATELSAPSMHSMQQKRSHPGGLKGMRSRNDAVGAKLQAQLLQKPRQLPPLHLLPPDAHAVSRPARPRV